MQTQLKRFSEFVAEAPAPRTIAFSIVSANPPGRHTQARLDALCEVASLNHCPYRAYVGPTKSRALDHATRVKTLREMFSQHARSVVGEAVVGHLEAAGRLHQQGFTDVIVCAPKDEVTVVEAILNENNGKPSPHFYNFRSIRVLPLAETNPTAEELMVAAARGNDLTAFVGYLPEGVEPEVLFNQVRVGLGLKESTHFRKHVQLDSVGERRERYINGELFEVGRDVVIKKTQEVAKVAFLGSNYLIVEQARGKRSRVWLDAVDPLEEKLTNDDSLPFAQVQYAPLKREPLGIAPRPLSELRRSSS